MSDRLAAYLNNHLAGARTAIALLETLRDAADDRPLKQFAAGLLVEVEADRDQLQRIIDTLGGRGGQLQAATAWLGEKAAPVTTRLGADPPLATLEMLEALALGVLGKLSLWRTLEALSATFPRQPAADYPSLIERAQAQHSSIEQQRLAAARRAFRV